MKLKVFMMVLAGAAASTDGSSLRQVVDGRLEATKQQGSDDRPPEHLTLLVLSAQVKDAGCAVGLRGGCQ